MYIGIIWDIQIYSIASVSRMHMYKRPVLGKLLPLYDISWEGLIIL